jgi:hypothetical protein
MQRGIEDEFRSWEILSVSKNRVKNPASASQKTLVRGMPWQRTGKRGMREIRRNISALSGFDWESLPPGFLYSPFNAVVEKIPLSLGQVN